MLLGCMALCGRFCGQILKLESLLLNLLRNVSYNPNHHR